MVLDVNPYSTVDPKGFWRPAVADRNMLDISDLWQPKFAIRPDMKISTYGSCFAQHFGRALDDRGFAWFRTEKRPFGLSVETTKTFNFDVFSSRTGNIYTASLLLQWLNWSFGNTEVPDEIWQKDGRFYDPFRPNIEPDGFASAEELVRSRAVTLKAFRRSVTEADVFVFTLGLTERWMNRAGYEYPMCPGTVAGVFDEAAHRFENMEFADVQAALAEALSILRGANEKLRVLFTVSPVPLTATYSGKHVLVATMQSKSILRAVAGQLADHGDAVDYFPSYEIINSPAFKGAFFGPNLRNVTAEGVTFVMESFFACQATAFGSTVSPGNKSLLSPEDLVCEEEILQQFGNKP